ncbi:type IV secretory system conjugative DNA transfer family protein [Alkalibacterium sp. 20]|uniref:type IV secretory system conjugative DNA transfer family protein n=1 Tax=Alkalibacterium sp. 20 TaxID=1798803 RepID=UPI0009001EEC|nr:type IV secretory system conjugative DNA transfer family protein [Alkalibacterium sp. 20]OJF90987.1 hypothetical protein AX762_11500 [Alkalibacterium sp. 20]
MIKNFLGNRFGLYPTTRLMDGLKIYSLMIFLLIVGYIFFPLYQEHAEQQFVETFGIPILDVEVYQSYIFYSIIIILFIIILRWTIRNKFSFSNYVLHFCIRQAMNRSHFSLDNKETTEFNLTRYKPPKTKLKWDNKERKTGKLFIRNRSDIEKGLEKINLSSELNGYNVETNYLTADNCWYVYELYALKTAEKKTFETKDAFDQWSNEANQYELRLDDRTTQKLMNTVIVGKTRSGKTYGVMSLLFQMQLKPIKYNLFFIDPKNSDGKTLGLGFAKENTIYETGDGNFSDDVLQMVDKYYQKMIERQNELNELINGRMALDYTSYNLEPHFLFIDELPSLIEGMEKKKQDQLLNKLGIISKMGSGSGFFIILIAQKLNAKVLPKETQENMLNKIILGNAGNQTYMTAIDRVEDVPKKNYDIGEGIYIDDKMSKPRMVNFPYLKFVDNIKRLDDVLKKGVDNSGDTNKSDH